MITKQKIDLYKKFNGDSDGFARCGTDSEKELMQNDWLLIDSIFQDLELVNRNLCSDDYKRQVIITLKRITDEHAFNELIIK